MGSILVVETDPDTRDRIGGALREARHEVLVARTMREAYLRVSEGGIDVVVIDSYDPLCCEKVLTGPSVLPHVLENT